MKKIKDLTLPLKSSSGRLPVAGRDASLKPSSSATDRTEFVTTVDEFVSEGSLPTTPFQSPDKKSGVHGNPVVKFRRPHFSNIFSTHSTTVAEACGPADTELIERNSGVFLPRLNHGGNAKGSVSVGQLNVKDLNVNSLEAGSSNVSGAVSSDSRRSTPSPGGGFWQTGAGAAILAGVRRGSTSLGGGTTFGNRASPSKDSPGDPHHHTSNGNHSHSNVIKGPSRDHRLLVSVDENQDPSTAAQPPDSPNPDPPVTRHNPVSDLGIPKINIIDQSPPLSQSVNQPAPTHHRSVGIARSNPPKSVDQDLNNRATKNNDAHLHNNLKYSQINRVKYPLRQYSSLEDKTESLSCQVDDLLNVNGSTNRNSLLLKTCLDGHDGMRDKASGEYGGSCAELSLCSSQRGSNTGGYLLGVKKRELRAPGGGSDERLGDSSRRGSVASRVSTSNTPRRIVDTPRSGKNDPAHATLGFTNSMKPVVIESTCGEETDLGKMEQSLLKLLEDFTGGNLSAFVACETLEKMKQVRAQQETLAKLHFELYTEQDRLADVEGTTSGRTLADTNLKKLTDGLKELNGAIRELCTDEVDR